MLLYCSRCNNLIDKINEETYSQGELMVRKCERCGRKNRFYVKYKAVIDKKWDKLTENKKFDIIGV